MEKFIIFLLGAFFGSELAYYFIYSPKAQVRRLWKQIHKVNQFKIDCGGDSVRDLIVNESVYTTISKQKKRINTLLDYYFDDEEDEKYRNKNRP